MRARGAVAGLVGLAVLALARGASASDGDEDDDQGGDGELPEALRVTSPRSRPATVEEAREAGRRGDEVIVPARRYVNPDDPSQVVDAPAILRSQEQVLPRNPTVVEDLSPQEMREVEERILRERARELGLPPRLPEQEGKVAPIPQSGGPDDFDLEAARREVRNVARHIYNAGGGYQRFKSDPRAWAMAAKGRYARRVVAAWQAKAGLVPDGLYGPRTRERMLELGAPAPPPALYTLRK